MNLTVHDAFEIRSNNTWINRSKSTPAPHSLFGDFWREGEMAVLFAHHGLGKTTLAMQIAESVARGKKSARESTRMNANEEETNSPPIRADSRYSRAKFSENPFPTTAPPQTVLYLDLEMTAKQIELRYSRDADDGQLLKSHHRFSERLKRVEVRPDLLAGRGERPVDEILYDLIEPLIRETGARVLIVDNIGCLRRSAYSTRECVRFMKDLHRLKCLHNLSVLVIAASQKSRTPRLLSIADLQSLKAIADHADTIFAIGQSSYDANERYVKHIRTRNAEIVHSEEHVPVFRLKKIARNFLGFEFQRFTEEQNLLRNPPRQADRESMQKILELTKQGLPIRTIAEQLEMSKSTVHRLRTEAQLWQRSAPTEPTTEQPDAPDDTVSIYNDPSPEAAILRRETYLRSRKSVGPYEPVESAGSIESIESPESPESIESIPSIGSFSSPDSPDTTESTDPPDPIFSLPRDIDEYGREIYIEKPGILGRHYLWYYFDKNGVKTRNERRGYGIFITKHP
jgi:hypothetical protein